MTRSLRLSIPLLALCLPAAAHASEDPEPAVKLPLVRVRLTSLGSPARLTVRAQGGIRATDAATGRTLEVGDSPLAVSASAGKVEVDGEPAYRLPRVPVQVDEQPPVLRRAPEHGEHTEEVLLELGYGWDEITALRDDAVIP